MRCGRMERGWWLPGVSVVSDLRRESVLTGGCLCGSLRYEITGAPLFVAQCYCRDCQKATGTGHTTIVGVMNTQLAIVKGTPSTYTNLGESGGSVTRHFCGICAGRLFTSGDLPGPVRMIQAGSLDNPNAISPTSALYVKDRLRWDLMDPALEQHQRLPAN